MTAGPRHRIAVLQTHPIQYYVPLYAALDREDDFEVTVFYLSDVSVRGGRDPGFGVDVAWDIDLLSGYRAVFAKDASRRGVGGFFSLAGLDVFEPIRRGAFDALLVHGHNLAATFVAIAAAKASGTPILMRGDSHLRLPHGGLRGAVRGRALTALYAAVDGFLAIGTANRAYYRSFGVPDDKISLVPFAVDNARFVAGSTLSDDERRSVRASLGVDDDRPAIVYASKFEDRKHPQSLVRAAQKLAGEGLPFHLVLVGGGSCEAELRALVAAGGPPSTHFAGFVNQSRLPATLGACDLFVLASEREPWGLIVNEAMCAGLPVVVGDEIGCVADLVRPGENGVTVRAGDDGALAAALAPLVVDATLRARMGARSREIVAGWSVREGVEGWREAMAKLARRRAGPRTGPPAADAG